MPSRPLLFTYTFRKEMSNRMLRSSFIRTWRSKFIQAHPFFIWGVVFPFLVWVAWMALHYSGLANPDALDWAQAARHLSRGDGFVTSAIVPLSLRVAPRLVGHPDLGHAPVFVVWEALWFRLGGARPIMAIFASGAAWVLALWMTYALATRLFHREIAFFAVLLLAANAAVLNASVSGLPMLLTGALILGILWTLAGPHPPKGQETRPATRLPWIWPVGSGVLAGLTILSDYALIWSVTLPVLFFWVTRIRETDFEGHGEEAFPQSRQAHASMRRARRNLRGYLPVALCAMGLFLSLLPWMVRNTRVAGSPSFNLGRYEVMINTPDYPGGSIYRRFPDTLPNPWEHSILNARHLARKDMLALSSMIIAYASLAGVVALGFLVVGCLRPPIGMANRIQRCFLVILLTATVIVAFTSQQLAGLLCFVPGIAVFAAAAAHKLVCRDESDASDFGPPWWTRRRVWPLWAATLLAALPLAGEVARGRRPERLDVTPNISYLKKNVPKGSAVMSDSPWLVAWYCDRPAVWLAQDEGDLADIQKKVGNLSWLYFTRYRTMLSQADISQWWIAALQCKDSYQGFQVEPSKAPNEVLLRHSTRVARPNAMGTTLAPRVAQALESQ